MKWTIPTSMQERIKTSNISSTPSESYDDVRHEIVKALCFWSANGKIDFEETESEADAHLKFQFGFEAVETHDTGNEDKVKKLDANFDTAVIAHAFPPPPNVEEYKEHDIYSDVHINLMEHNFWKITPIIDPEDPRKSYRHISSPIVSNLNLPTNEGLSFTLAHEIGHSLGYPHSGEPKSVMFNKKTEDIRWDDKKAEMLFFKDKVKHWVTYGTRKNDLPEVCQWVVQDEKPYSTFGKKSLIQLKVLEPVVEVDVTTAKTQTTKRDAALPVDVEVVDVEVVDVEVVEVEVVEVEVVDVGTVEVQDTTKSSIEIQETTRPKTTKPQTTTIETTMLETTKRTTTATTTTSTTTTVSTTTPATTVLIIEPPTEKCEMMNGNLMCWCERQDGSLASIRINVLSKVMYAFNKLDCASLE